MFFQSCPEMRGKSFSEAFADLLDPADILKIFTEDGNVSVVSRNLVRFFSPLVNNILKDVPCCTTCMVFIPDVSKASVEHVLSIIGSGITDFNVMSIKQIQEIQETAKMLEIDLTNIDYVEKGMAVAPDVAKENKEAIPASQRTEVNEMILQIKTERPEFNEFIDSIEALLVADSAAIVEGSTKLKEEPLNQNSVVPNHVEKSEEDSPVKSHPFLAPTPPSEPESESSKSNSRSSPKHEQYLHKVRSSKRGNKKSISEETMSALAKMMQDPKRKPTMDEMEELLSRTKSFKDNIAKPAERRRRESHGSPDRKSDRRRSYSKERRPRSVDRRSVSPESSHSAVAQPSPVNFPYLQMQQGQHQYSQYQNHPQMPQHGQVHPPIQYMVQPSGAVQAYGAVPAQYPYSTVQGMDHVQFSMVQAPTSTVQYQVRSPSPLHRRYPSESSSRSELSKYHSKMVRTSDRSMAEKKASLMTMTVAEKRLMTCLDWNTGMCPRLDLGKLCVFGGSKKKHICSKVIKSSGFGGSKVCWGKHREGEHKDRVEVRDNEKRRDSREMENRS